MLIVFLDVSDDFARDKQFPNMEGENFKVTQISNRKNKKYPFYYFYNIWYELQ